jgi:2-dehydro-3-deoxyphosphogluconate aldolase/(4S)-4-hydroxy-2-oxoglutarate aldolase
MTIAGILRVSPVIPVVVIEDEDDAVPLAQALVAGGVKVIEVTLRTEAALAAAHAISANVHDIVVGIGTVTGAEDFAAAAEAGARFVVSPGITDDLLQAAQASGLNYLPGVMTPSEVMRAREAGLSELKLFPADAAGGVALVQALAGPFPDVTFCPTGGISVEAARRYLEQPNVACVGGSWLTPRAVIGAQDWAAVTALARQAASLR